MNMISLSQGHCCSTTLCNKILKGKGVWIFWKYHMGVPRVGSDSKQMWNLTQSVEGWWRTGVQNTVGLSWSSVIMLLCSNFVVDIWLPTPLWYCTEGRRAYTCVTLLQPFFLGEFGSSLLFLLLDVLNC
jgi:hypothetical protein